MPHLIRPFRPDDFGRVLDIAVAAFSDIHCGFEDAVGPDIFAAEYAGWQAKYDRYLKTVSAPGSKKHFYVVCDGDAVVAFIEFWIDGEKRTGEIGLNGVDPAHRGIGIGKLMYNHALAVMKEKGAILAKVSTGMDAAHAPARAAYEAAGFEARIPSVTYFRKL